MTIAQIIALAYGSSMHDGGIGAGWWIVMVTVMVVFMGAMMWMMMRGMGGGSARDSSGPSDGDVSRQSPVEALERRLAEGEISIEEYRARREALVSGREPSGAHEDEQLARPRAGR